MFEEDANAAEMAEVFVKAVKKSTRDNRNTDNHHVSDYEFTSSSDNQFHFNKPKCIGFAIFVGFVITYSFIISGIVIYDLYKIHSLETQGSYYVYSFNKTQHSLSQEINELKKNLTNLYSAVHYFVPEGKFNIILIKIH